ncbi:MAG: CDP-alcohol phosphatidyltransferase family protein [Candidatus Thiodiazotropha sp.]
MPTIYDLKPRFQALLRPLSDGLAGAGVTPNQVTLAALLLSLLNGAAISLFPQQAWPLLLLPPVLFLRMALNAIDGMLAREHAMQSRLGAILNELGDVVSDSVLYLPLALVAGVDPRLVVLIVLAAVMGEMAGVIGTQIGASRRYDGPLGKSDRAFVFGLLALLLGLGVPAGLWVSLLLGVTLALALLTILNRARQALREAA